MGSLTAPSPVDDANGVGDALLDVRAEGKHNTRRRGLVAVSDSTANRRTTFAQSAFLAFVIDSAIPEDHETRGFRALRGRGRGGSRLRSRRECAHVGAVSVPSCS